MKTKTEKFWSVEHSYVVYYSTFGFDRNHTKMKNIFNASKPSQNQRWSLMHHKQAIAFQDVAINFL